MKNYFFKTLLIFLISILNCKSLNAQTKFVNKVIEENELTAKANTYEIAVWKNFAKAVITHTWDDNTSKQLTNALPIYDAYNFKATFFTITNWKPNWEGLKKAYNNGHEIASHTLNHPNFNEITTDEIENELKASQQRLNKEIADQSCLTIAFPFCATESANLTEKYYVAARICDRQIVPQTPTDFMRISSFSCGTETPNTTVDHFNNIAKKALKSNGWAVYLFHGIDNGDGWSPIKSSVLEAHLNFLKQNEDTYWVDTFINVVKYIKERNSVSANEISVNEEQIKVEFTDDLDDSIYNIPITVKTEIPQNWEAIKVYQNKKLVDCKTSIENGKKYAIFNIIPDNGLVVLNKG